MGRLASNQRVVRSIRDRSGNAYTKTSAGGKARATSAAKYMDQKEEKDLYRYDKRSGLAETTRHEVAEFIERTDTRYQQHMAFTTQVRGDAPMLPDHERQTAQELAQAIQARRPDAEIHALAVHQQGQEGNIHVHVVFGTDTTLRREDLSHFREVAYQMEKNLEERLRVLQLNWQVPLREEVNKEGSRVREVEQGDTGRARPSGREPELDLNDLKRRPQRQQELEERAPKKERQQDIEWGG